MSAGLLPFHRTILEEIHDPSTSQLVLLARGLGLRKIVCTLMQIYDSPNNLIILVNASSEEEAAVGEELGIMGCRRPGLRTVGYEMGKKERQELYKNGGLISVTSRILVVDMLQSDLPTELVTGLLVLRAEKVTALSLEAFIVRLYREKNSTGFLKAFSDQPEHITSGLSPLKSIMKELQLRTALIYPRFHQAVKDSLERKRADVVELYQPMTESMKEIHGALVQCMSMTLTELKRSNTTLELDDLNVENAYFRSFDAIVRRQLDPVWHKVGPRTKQLVGDLAILRRLLTFLLNYDPLAFNAYLETIVASNQQTVAGNPRQNQSPWLLSDAAHIIFETAKKRCYISRQIPDKSAPTSTGVIEISDDEEAWEALEEAEGLVRRTSDQKGKENAQAKARPRPSWLPSNIEPILEELPKWHLVAETLREIEEEIMRQEFLSATIRGSNVVLVMTSSSQTSSLLSEYLSAMDLDAPPGQQGRKMMENKFRGYLYWKARLSAHATDTQALPAARREESSRDDELNPALRKKDRDRAERVASRRRVRGGAPTSIVTRMSAADQAGAPTHEGEVLAELLATQDATSADAEIALALSLEDTLPPDDIGFDVPYGIVAPAQTVIVRAYTDDSDDRMLAELQPRFIVMYEPNQDFVRRIEVYKASHPGVGVRVYFMVYQMTAEEHKYLASLRKEKDAFERLIRERGSMLLPIYENNRAATSETGDVIIKTISTRLAGGRKELSTEPSRVIVDMREFRSTLPSLLHASKMIVVPATLTVGDYILTPDICVERKSIPDLVSSFNSGRLYTQCELMSVHYKQPILLIEFEEHKSFSLEIVQDAKSYAKPTGKYPSKKPGASGGAQDTSQSPSIQQKLVLLTLSFPRVRILWSSSPYATADVFKDLKASAREPDYATAVAVGADTDPAAGAGVHGPAEELLRTLPGITAKNAGYVMSRVGSVRALCELPLEQVQDILGSDPGKACWEFLHWGEIPERA